VQTPEDIGPDGKSKKKAFRVGEKVEVTIQADYYFGGPVANASVEVLVHQNPFYQSWHKPREFPWFYEDMDGNSAWTPRDMGHASREGLAGVAFTVLDAGTSTVVASDTTMDNGAFSAKVLDGTYDVRFTGSSLPGGVLMITGVTVSGTNVDVGDWDTAP